MNPRGYNPFLVDKPNSFYFSLSNPTLFSKEKHKWGAYYA
jgi:hypothetical protein